MSAPKIGIKTKKAGGSGTIHKRSVEDCLSRLKESSRVPEGTLTPLTALTPSDFEGGLRVVAISRCLDTPEIIVQTITADDIHYNRTNEASVPLVFDSHTVRYKFNDESDTPDVIRAVIPNQ